MEECLESLKKLLEERSREIFEGIRGEIPTRIDKGIPGEVREKVPV